MPRLPGTSAVARLTVVAGIWLGVIGVWLAGTASAQQRPNVRADDRDMTIVIGGEVIFDAVVQTDYWRDEGQTRGYELIAAYMRLDFDFRFSSDGGVYAALATRRREYTGMFDEFPRTRGAIVGDSNLDLEVDELFVEIQRLFNLDLTVRAGQAHIRLGLDTEAEKLWDGHGRLWLDTMNGQGPADFDRMHPIGVQLTWGVEQGLAFTGYAAYLHRNLLSDDESVWLAALQTRLKIDDKSRFIAGYARWFDQAGPDLEVAWAGLKVYASPQVMAYAEFMFQFGNGNSGEGGYFGSRFTSAEGSFFVDVSAWLLTGDDPTTAFRNEGFISYGSINTTWGVDGLDYGLGRHTNVTAVKIVLSYRLIYNLRLHAAFGRYSAMHSDDSPRPGDELDLFLIYETNQQLEIRGGAAWLFTSRVHGEDGNPDGWMFIVSARGRF